MDLLSPSKLTANVSTVFSTLFRFQLAAPHSCCRTIGAVQGEDLHLQVAVGNREGAAQHIRHAAGRHCLGFGGMDRHHPAILVDRRVVGAAIGRAGEVLHAHRYLNAAALPPGTGIDGTIVLDDALPCQPSESSVVGPEVFGQ